VYLFRGHAQGLLRNSFVKLIKADYVKNDYRFVPLDKTEKNFKPVKVSKPNFETYSEQHNFSCTNYGTKNTLLQENQPRLTPMSLHSAFKLR